MQQRTLKLFQLFITLLTVLPFLALAQDQHPYNVGEADIHNAQQTVGMAQRNSLNVFQKPLAFFSNQPVTGWLRNGYCDVPAGDFGNHAVAGEVTEEFLDFTASRGNDLRIAGLTGGCKWCLCASRWLEAFEARKSDTDPVVPKVFLNATNEKALNTVDLVDLKKFAKEE